MSNTLKSHDVAKWFIYNNPSLASGYFDENAKLNKLLYFSSLMYYCVQKQELLDEKFVAFPRGPVIMSVYRDYRYNELDRMPSSDEIQQADNVQKQIISIVNFVYGDKSASDLIDKTHEHSLWRNVSDLIPNNPIIDFSNVDQKLINHYLNLYDIYKNTDFSDLKKEKINGNIFYYCQSNLNITDDIVSQLSDLPFSKDPRFIENIDGELVFS